MSVCRCFATEPDCWNHDVGEERLQIFAGQHGQQRQLWLRVRLFPHHYDDHWNGRKLSRDVASF